MLQNRSSAWYFKLGKWKTSIKKQFGHRRREFCCRWVRNWRFSLVLPYWLSYVMFIEKIKSCRSAKNFSSFVFPNLLFRWIFSVFSLFLAFLIFSKLCRAIPSWSLTFFEIRWVLATSAVSLCSVKWFCFWNVVYFWIKPVTCFRTALFLLQILSQYCDALLILPEYASELLMCVVELLKNYNSRSCQLILGAGALQLIGLKSISVRHLGKRFFLFALFFFAFSLFVSKAWGFDNCYLYDFQQCRHDVYSWFFDSYLTWSRNLNGIWLRISRICYGI